MILNSFYSEGFVAHSHDDAGVGTGVDLEDGREGCLCSSKRVITGDGDVLRDVTVDSFRVMLDMRGLAVDNFTSKFYSATECAENALSGIAELVIPTRGFCFP